MMKKFRFLLSLLIGICIAGATVSSFTLTRAWLAGGNAFGNMNLTASSVSNYFARGDGTENNPYIIEQPIHMYNLSWLQARGIFDDQKTYFKVAGKSDEPITIDFAGSLDGNTGRTGALPPIGTDSHTFIGEFDGNGSVLKNLWISSNPDDWKEKPSDIGDADTNTHVGFFGNIEQNSEGMGVVRNFTLENIEVTSHIDSSFVGLIAGYSNSYTENIGVKNGKLSFRQGSQNHYMSEASLIGKVGEDAYWEDMPSDSSAGGELKIDPNSSDWTGGHYSGVGSNQTLEVPNSTPGTAYVSGSMTYNAQGLQSVYKYNTKLSFTSDSGKTITATQTNSTNALNNRVVCSGEFWNTYDNSKDNSYAITPSTTAPSNSPTNSFTVDGVSKTIPQNCIWFKPQAGGTCGISFTISNNKDSRYMSIYRYLRNGNNIPATNAWNEIKLAFTKGNFKNKTVVYYEVEISDAEVETGYEYCISVSRSNSANPGNFFFLYLAGASETGKPSEGKALLKNLDYVYKYNGQYLPAFDENYTPNHVKLFFDFSAESDDIVFLFNMDDIQNSTNVYYYTSGPTINNEITYASVGVLESTTAKFPPRSET